MQKGNLLIVDDEPILVTVLSMLLGPQSHKIFTAENGQAALAILAREEIHCIISDVSMPVMNGVQFLKSYRKSGGSKPFIFYSAHGNEALLREASKYGAFDFLDKPNLSGLEEVVTRGLALGLGPAVNIEPGFDDLIVKLTPSAPERKCQLVTNDNPYNPKVKT